MWISSSKENLFQSPRNFSTLLKQCTKLTHVDTDQPPSAKWEAHTLGASPQPAKLAKTVECYKRSTPGSGARLGTTAKKEEGQIDMLAGWASWHLH